MARPASTPPLQMAVPTLAGMGHLTPEAQAAVPHWVMVSMVPTLVEALAGAVPVRRAVEAVLVVLAMTIERATD